jgi:hypothetical protein
MEKIDLSPEQKRPLDKSQLGQDVAALRGLVAFMNNPEITGAVVPPEEKVAINKTFQQPLDRRGASIPIDPIPSSIDRVTPTASNILPEQTINPASLGRKIFFTGRIGVGKDYNSAAIGARVIGFADPLYQLVEYLTGQKVTSTDGKQIPGVRKFLQMIGQWGRNEINEQYPLTPERAMFSMMVRSLANQNITFGEGVDWGNFGYTPDLWVEGLLKRAEVIEGRIAVTNCRYNNEYRKLLANDFQHWHCVCSPATWTTRLASLGLSVSSPEIKDMSEKLAQGLDSDLTKKISTQRHGPKLQVIWSDDKAPSPSNRFYTTQEFLDLSKR